MLRRYGLIFLILLVAVALRLWLLADIPPGMTHDEADHGVDAWGVVNGIRPIYFTVGYGREPLFDYSTATLMAFLGPTFLAGRLTAVLYSLILIIGSYAWADRAYNRRVALFTAAGLAVSFWALMTGRHALRSVTMPALFTLSATLLWTAIPFDRRNLTWRQWLSFLGAGIILGITYYSYLPARLIWLLLPMLLIAWLIIDRDLLRRSWHGITLTLLTSGFVGAPLFYHLLTTEAEQRLDQLSGPLDAARNGDFGPLLDNIIASLRLFTIEGDSLWRYNIPGRPFLTPLMGVLFYVGLLVALFYILNPRNGIRCRSASLFALGWLVIGFAPALITGPEASVTRVIAMQPVLYLFPALVIDGVWNLIGHRSELARYAIGAVCAVLFTIQIVDTGRAYFGTWANASEVRVQYEATRVTAMRYLNDNGTGVAAISSPEPDRFHDPATAQMTLSNPNVSLRWFDGAGSLLIPQDETSTVVFSEWAALAPALQRYFESAELTTTIPLRETDLDRPITVYAVDTSQLIDTITPTFVAPAATTTFGSPNLTYLGLDLLTPDVPAGGVVQLATLWRIEQPMDDAVLFTHVVGADNRPIAQADRLDVPSYYWQAGDYFIQLHEFTVPADATAADYPLAIGAYTRETETRLPATVGTTAVGDLVEIGTLTITP